MTLTSKLGDTRTFSVPLRWGNKPFSPGSAWGLVFTVKASESDPDSSALFQKSGPNTNLGVELIGSEAYVTVLRADTYREVNFPTEGSPAFQAAPGTYYWDIQASGKTGSGFEGQTRTLADGTFRLTRDITRAANPTKAIFTEEEPVFQGPSAYDIAVANGFVGTEEEWLASLKGEPGDPGVDGEGTNNTTIGPVPPENPQPGDTWIDTEGWIESYWHAQEDAGEAGGYWISTQPRPSNVGFLVYGTYSLIWTPVEAGTEYNLIWTPTT
jgi:hypothetical protein